MVLALSGPTPAVLARFDDAPGLLSAAESERLAALRSPADRADFLAAHALVRLCAARLLSVPVGSLTVVQHCPSCSRPHGRPSLAGEPGVGISLSHTSGFVAAAAADGPVGVDIELVRDEPLDWRVAELAASPDEFAALRRSARPERDFVRQWVRKEALVKVGVTSLDDMAEIHLPVTDSPVEWGDWRLDHWTASGSRAVGCVASRGGPRVEQLS